MSCSRGTFERAEAAMRRHTIAEMRAAGWYSATCPCMVEGCPGWQAVAVPPEAPDEERKATLMSLLGYEPKRFGEGGA